jgi:hypothetical protein
MHTFGLSIEVLSNSASRDVCDGTEDDCDLTLLPFFSSLAQPCSSASFFRLELILSLDGTYKHSVDEEIHRSQPLFCLLHLS